MDARMGSLMSRLESIHVPVAQVASESLRSPFTMQDV